jgi:hypothetical protein
VTIPFQPKAIQDEMGEAYEVEYGRMGGMLGVELPNTVSGNQNFMLYPYPSPPTDMIADTADLTATPIGGTGDGTQIWQITHNGVDTHPIHVHLFNVQLINRIGWDGAMLPPEPGELGWKETVRVNPLEQTFLALRPTRPTVPFDVPNSIRPINPAMPVGALLMPPPGGSFQSPLDAQPVANVTNQVINYGDEYVWHCHILSHEEMDMMHSLSLATKPAAPTALSAVLLPRNRGVQVSWRDNSVNETAFRVERHVFTGVIPAADSPGWVVVATVPSPTGRDVQRTGAGAGARPGLRGPGLPVDHRRIGPFRGH